MEPASLQNLLDRLRDELRGDPFWAPRLEQAKTPGPEASAIHLAVMIEPFLSLKAGRP